MHFCWQKEMRNHQWSSRESHPGDQDPIKISRRDRDFVKNSETPDLKVETETRDFKISAFCRNFLKKFRHHFWLEFLQISVIFPMCFGGFLPANTTNQKSLNHRNFNTVYHFFEIFKISRPETVDTETMPETFETETHKNRFRGSSRDLDQVSRLHHWKSQHNCEIFLNHTPILQITEEFVHQKIEWNTCSSYTFTFYWSYIYLLQSACSHHFRETQHRNFLNVFFYCVPYWEFRTIHCYFQFDWISQW